MSYFYQDTITINEIQKIKNEVLLKNLKALTDNSKLLNSIDKIIVSNELKIKHNSSFFKSSILCKEKELTILTKYHKIRVFEKRKPCIVEEHKNNGEYIEHYYLPKDESYSEKGLLAMQKVYNTNGELIEKYYNRNILLHPYIKNNIWRKEAYEYDLGVMIRQTNFTQSARRDLSNRRNPYRISYRKMEEFDYSEHNYFYKDQEDKNMLILDEILWKVIVYNKCDNNIMSKIVYYD